jgi:hypothetical protein
MYREKMLSVCKITNGFLIEVRAPYKIKKEKGQDSEKEVSCCGPDRGYAEQELFAKDATDLGQKIEALMPMLEREFTSEDDFEGAFAKAAKA